MSLPPWSAGVRGALLDPSGRPSGCLLTLALGPSLCPVSVPFELGSHRCAETMAHVAVGAQGPHLGLETQRGCTQGGATWTRCQRSFKATSALILLKEQSRASSAEQLGLGRPGVPTSVACACSPGFWGVLGLLPPRNHGGRPCPTDALLAGYMVRGTACDPRASSHVLPPCPQQGHMG